MDLVSYAMSKDYSNGLALGFSTVKNMGNGVVRFELTDGTDQYVDVQVPTVKGQDGQDGQDGDDGVGISSVEITNSHLIVTLTDGREIDAGEISGGGGEGTTVIANPILSGDEDTATSIQIGDEKYVFPETNTYGFTQSQITMFEGILKAGVYSSDQSSAIDAFITSLRETPEPTPKELSSITAVINNTTVEQGQTYTPSGTVTAHYSDGTSANVTASSQFSTIDTSTTGSKTLTITYTENEITKTTTETITVTDEPVIKTLSSISATKTKTTYTVNETFNTSDVVVTAHYSDSTTATVTSSATIGTVDTSTEGNKTLNISYTEDSVTKTTTISITVEAGSTGEVIYTKSELICEVTTDGQKFGDSHTPWVASSQYKYEFDYEITSNPNDTLADLRDVNATGQNIFGLNKTEGSTGHISHTMTANSTRDRQAFVGKGTGYTVKLTNVVITKLS